MRVLLVNKFWYQRGGSERVALLTKNILESQGHDVAVFGMQHPENIFDEPYFSPRINYAAPTLLDAVRSIYNWPAKKKFARLIGSFKPDVIHFHNIYHELSFSLIDAGREAKIPMVLTLHDYHWLSPNYRLFRRGRIDESCGLGMPFRCITQNCLESFGKSVVGTIDFILRSRKKYRSAIRQFICPSEYIARKHAAAGWTQNSLTVVPNPIIQTIRQRPFVDGGHVLFAGRLSLEKGVDSILSAARFTPNIPYIIMGDGPERASLESQAQSYGLTNVRFVGHLTGLEREHFFEQARLVVVPSKWLENAPLVIGEAAGWQKIILGSKRGGIPEELPSDWLVRDDDPKLWADAIAHWYHRPVDEREKRGRTFAAAMAARHDPAQYLRSIEKIYKMCITPS